MHAVQPVLRCGARVTISLLLDVHPDQFYYPLRPQMYFRELRMRHTTCGLSFCIASVLLRLFSGNLGRDAEAGFHVIAMIMWAPKMLEIFACWIQELSFNNTSFHDEAGQLQILHVLFDTCHVAHMLMRK
jgi:hypothetical protein